MNSYGSSHNPPGDRDRPDAADIRNLGLSSRHGNTRSASKHATRRVWKKKERAATKAAIYALSE